jgi:glycosyltransferase involved in cell wall biosynthesis
MLTNESISLVVPTRNRGYALKQVAESWYAQPAVSEIVIVDDAGTDGTSQIVEEIAQRFPGVSTKVLRNPERKGAAFCRLEGVKAAENEIILFCDDDDFLGPDYAGVLRRKLQKSGASIVAGRHFYRLRGEAVEDAIRRFENGLFRQRPFDRLRFRLNSDARMQDDVELPFTHGIFMARRSLLLHYGIDPFYGRGNGFREETDFQMQAYLDGHRIVMTNGAHAVHLHPSEVKTGGQRVNRLQRYYWTVYYTRYFFGKYFDRARVKLGLPYSRSTAVLLFALIELYVFFIRPLLMLPGRLVVRLRGR